MGLQHHTQQAKPDRAGPSLALGTGPALAR